MLMCRRTLLFLFCLFLYSFETFARTVVISDIDDTLKQANSVGTAPEQIYHFLKKVPYLDMRNLFNEIKNNEKKNLGTIRFFYVSAAKDFTFNADKWIQKNQFPIGRSTLKTLNEKRSTYDFKHAVIKDIIEAEKKTLNVEENESLHILMFGDNAQADAMVYSDLTHEMHLDSAIFIRDVRAEATFFNSTLPIKKIIGVNYFFSEVELLAFPEFHLINPDLKLKTYDNYKRRALIPQYTLKTLSRRLESLYGDKSRAASDALNFWNDYYSRF